jgi:hypothetical protein
MRDELKIEISLLTHISENMRKRGSTALKSRGRKRKKKKKAENDLNSNKSHTCSGTFNSNVQGSDQLS